jgi:uncharacterized protein with NRDE domain
MCLIVLAYGHCAAYPLVLAGNRDELHARPTRGAAFWEDAPQVLAGRDLRAGGTWLGVTRSGRLAAISNFREPESTQSEAPSRGRLVSEYLCGQEPPGAFLERLRPRASHYAPFNLLVGDLDELFYYSNRGGAIDHVTPGVHGISNHLLDTPWPKVERGKAGMRRVLEAAGPLDFEAFFTVLADRTVPPDAELPDTGVGLDLERMLGPIFIAGTHYGTRSSTVLCIEQNRRVRFIERSFAPGGSPTGTAAYEFIIEFR